MPGGPRAEPDELAAALGVTCRFGSFVAVDAADVRVCRGEIVGLLGANGAGKTTLIRALLGMLRPDSGQVRLFGGPPSRKARGRLGYVAQSLGLYGELTVGENLQFVTGAFGAPSPELPSDLSAVVSEKVSGIGLGKQRQLAFACALAHHPELLVLDEPTSGVDPLSRARLWDEIHRQADAGIGVLVTTHYLQEAQQCDRLVMMAAGRVAIAGGLADIIGGRSAVRVRADSWIEPFTALRAHRAAVMLAGSDVRVADRGIEEVRAVLRAAGIRAKVEEVPATLEETMVTIGARR
jgi:ABC-2 type transport system ATP-binding protein/ribosome-dependent ATPase